MGLVRLVTKELRENGIVRLPHLGDLALIMSGGVDGRPISVEERSPNGEIKTMKHGRSERMYTLHFYILYAWHTYLKAYFKSQTGREAKLDPREKLLNEELL